MTVGQRIFHLLDEKNMTQREFSRRTGIATTTISDWRKKNTNPGSEKILAICAALDVTPECLLSGVCEDSVRGRSADYMVIPAGTDERLLIELYNDMDWTRRSHLLEYARSLAKKDRSEEQGQGKRETGGELCERDGKAPKRTMKKIADFCDIEVYIDPEFSGNPSIDLYYADDNIVGSADLRSGSIKGGFSKYVLPVISAWLADHRDALLNMWQTCQLETLPEWG